MTNAKDVIKELEQYSNPERAKQLKAYFKTGHGGYGADDKFIAVKVPDQRKVSKKLFKEIPLSEVKKLLYSPIHEYRETGFMILCDKFKKAGEEERKEIYNFHLQHISRANNWDLVDGSAPWIIGFYLLDKKDRKILYKLARSKSLWENRSAIVATQMLIRNHQYEDTLEIAEILLDHPHDLIHKAVGWMLREVGNKDLKTEETFLKKYYKKMPRTMLRYAIEKFEENTRQKYLKGEI